MGIKISRRKKIERPKKNRNKSLARSNRRSRSRSRRRSRRRSKKKTTNKKKSSIGGKSKRKSKKKSKKKQRGGNINNINIINIILILLFFYLYLRKQAVNKDFYGIKDDIDVGYSDDLILPEEVGLSLIPYTQEVSDAIIKYVTRNDFEHQAHILSLDDSGNIEENGIKLYFNPYLKDILDFTMKDYETQEKIQKYDHRDLALEYIFRWFDTEIRDYNLPEEGYIRKILKACLPGIHLLTGKIPKKLFMAGLLSKNVNTFFPQWHQDYPATNRLYPNVADYNIRLMLIPQKGYEKYPELINFSKNPDLTEFARQVDNYKPVNRFHPDNSDYGGIPGSDYFKTNIAQKVNLKIDQTEYVAIMFNNYKILHKSPEIKADEGDFDRINLLNNFLSGFIRSSPRDVIQLQFIFNDKDLITPTTDIKQGLGEFNHGMIKNIEKVEMIENIEMIEDKLQKDDADADADIEEMIGGMFRN